jgi:hypothetical protein
VSNSTMLPGSTFLRMWSGAIRPTARSRLEHRGLLPARRVPRHAPSSGMLLTPRSFCQADQCGCTASIRGQAFQPKGSSCLPSTCLGTCLRAEIFYNAVILGSRTEVHTWGVRRGSRYPCFVRAEVLLHVPKYCACANGHCWHSPSSLVAQLAHADCTRTRRANSRVRARAGSLTHTQTARACGERTVAPAPVQALSLTHRLHAHAESKQSRPRPCRLPLSHTDCARTRRANSRARARAGSLSRAQTARARGVC